MAMTDFEERSLTEADVSSFQPWMQWWITQKEDGWYFFDPSGDEFGPYPDQETCCKALSKHNYEG